MFKNMTRRRKGLVAANVIAATAVVTMLGATPAGAQVPGAANTLLIGSGSATAYNLMQGMDTLYNDSPGCNLITITTVTQPLDYSCPPANETIPPPTESTVYPPYPDFSSSPGYTENPANDVAAEEPPLGSSFGIKQMETQTGGSSCASTASTATIDYARSSRAFASSDCKGLNFVAYAVDGVSFFTYPEVNGHTTPSAVAKNLSQALLVDAWNGTLQCWNDPVVAAGSGTPTYTYATSGCKPILLYSAQSGSGTLSTWTSFLGGLNPQTYIGTLNGSKFDGDCIQGTNGKCITNYKGYKSNDHIILENEDRALIANGDEANALFFFSYGKFQVTCKVGKCGVIKGANGTTKEALGSINGVKPTKSSILCGAGVQTQNCTTFFSPTRFLYNVYSNGSNPSIAEASPQALNYVSEEGFICKPNTTNGTSSGTPITDPNTGANYGGSTGEIASVITGQGFFQLPFQSNEGSVDNPAYTLLQNYASAHPSNTYDGEVASVDTVGQSATDESGYCLVFTTDSNSGQ